MSHAFAHALICLTQIKSSGKAGKDGPLQAALNEMRMSLQRDPPQLERFDTVR
jgi:hypothetical protein